MLADIEDPPRSRVPGMIFGLIVAAPIAAILLVWFVPTLVQAVLGGAESIDGRLKLENQYMQAVCTEALDLGRDEAMCSCALATEHPALDCQAPFLVWSVERQLDYCSDEGPRKAALSFCSCVDAVNEAMDKAGPEGRSAEAQAYRNCQALDDAVFLPTIEQLTPVE
ncbi:MAG: hypothetical protein AAF721_25780 [Myxococcota bacterium]